jgi:hypothetical protein
MVLMRLTVSCCAATFAGNWNDCVMLCSRLPLAAWNFCDKLGPKEAEERSSANMSRTPKVGEAARGGVASAKRWPLSVKMLRGERI